MTDWDLLARRMGFACEKELLMKFYIDHELSLSEIGGLLCVTKAFVQKRLAYFGIPRRARGGPNHDHNLQERLRLLDPREVWLAPKEVAKLLSTNLTTVYRLRKETLL